MGGCTEHGVQCGQLIGYEGSHFPHGLSLQDHHQVIAAGDQVHALHLGVFVDPLRHAVEPLSALGGYTHLDQGSHLILGSLLPVDQGMVAADDALRFHIRQFLGYHRLFCPQKDCQFL